MNKKLNISIAVLLFLVAFLAVGELGAQPPPPPPPPSGGPPCWPPPCIPVDGGITIALAAAAAFGGKKVYDALKKSGN